MVELDHYSCYPVFGGNLKKTYHCMLNRNGIYISFREDEMKKRSLAFLLIMALMVYFIASCQHSPVETDESASATDTPAPEGVPTLSLDASPVTCEEAAEYLNNNEFELARNSFSAITIATPGAKCALQGLILVDMLEKDQQAPPEPTPGFEDVVPALLNNGDYAGAWEKLKEGVAANPDSTSKSNFWLWLWKAWNYAKNLTTDILIPMAMAVFIILLIFPLIKIINPFKRRIIVDIADFKPGSASEVDEKMCLSVSNKIQENLFNYHKKQLMNNVNIITSAIDAPELPDSISSKASGIWNFLIKLYPTKIFSVSGILEYHKTKGVGLALTTSFTNDHKILGHITFWDKEHNLPTPEPEKSSLLEKIFTPKKGKTEEPAPTFNKDDYYAKIRPLAMVASAWVFWQYCTLDKNIQLKSIFGTNVFESYKWYLIYLYQLQLLTSGTSEEKQEKARPYLLKSLAADRCNTVALFAFCQYYLDPKKKPENREPFEKTMKQVIGNGKDSDLTTILAHYWLGDLYLNECLKKHTTIPQIDEADRKKCFDEQFKPAYEGIQKATSITEDVRGCVQIPYLLSFVMSGDINRAKKELIKIEEMRTENENLLYNLACIYGVLATSDPELHEVSNELIQSYYSYQTYWQINRPVNFNEMAMVNLEKASFYMNFNNQEQANEFFKNCEEDQWLKEPLKVRSDVYQKIKENVATTIKVFNGSEVNQKSKK